MTQIKGMSHVLCGTNDYFLLKYLSEIKFLILQHLVSSIELNTQNSAANIEIDESITAQSDTNLGRGNISTDRVDSDTDSSHTPYHAAVRR